MIKLQRDIKAHLSAMNMQNADIGRKKSIKTSAIDIQLENVSRKIALKVSAMNMQLTDISRKIAPKASAMNMQLADISRKIVPKASAMNAQTAETGRTPGYDLTSTGLPSRALKKRARQIPICLDEDIAFYRNIYRKIEDAMRQFLNNL